MKRFARILLVLAVLTGLAAGAAAPAQADVTDVPADVSIAEVIEGLDVGALPVEVVPNECPEGYSGVVLDFYYGSPRRHLFTLRLCQNIKP